MDTVEHTDPERQRVTRRELSALTAATLTALGLHHHPQDWVRAGNLWHSRCEACGAFGVVDSQRVHPTGGLLNEVCPHEAAAGDAT